MSKLDRSSLLEFLNRPHCLREIVKHFEVPTKLVDYHLKEELESGGVLVYRKQIRVRSLNSKAKGAPSKRLLYISKNSPLLAKDLAGINSLPKTRSSAVEESTHQNRKDQVLSSEKFFFMNDLMTHLKLDKTELSRILSSLQDKMKLAKSSKNARRLKWKKRYDSHESESLSLVEKIRLFQALSKETTPFLDIHRRFGVSKQVVKGFVKRGFFEEVWGPKNIGVKYRLTEKGEAYLKRLENASHFEHQQRKKIFIRLKQRISSGL